MASSLFVQAQEVVYSPIGNHYASEAQLLATLEQNGRDVNANFLLACHYYNQAVIFIEQNQLQGASHRELAQHEEVYTLFRKAVPFAEYAYNNLEEKDDALRLLQGSWYGLGNMNMYNKYSAPVAH